MLIQNSKKSFGIKVVLFQCMGVMETNNFACLSNSSRSFFYFYFVKNLWKKNMAYVRLQLNLPFSPFTSQYTFSWTTPPPLWAYLLYEKHPRNPEILPNI